MIDPDAGDAVPAGGGATSTEDAAPAVRLCPYLLTETGWRAPTPTGEHRCTAVEPPARLASEKQARLCLVAEHSDCATYLAARVARAASGVPGGTTRRPIARTAPIVVERSRALLPVDLDAGARRWGQAGLVVLMLVALVAVVVARSGAGSSPGAVDGVGGSPAATGPAAPSSSSEATPSDEATPGSPAATPASPAPGATPTPGAVESAGPSPSAGGTYTVRRGDTLSAIAVRFGTTVAALQRANGITDPSLLRVGQVLRIP